MKRYRIITKVFAILILIGGCGEKGFKIEGKIDGDVNGKVVYLISDSESKPADSTVIEKNSFNFSGLIEYPGVYRIKIMKNQVDSEKPGARIYQPVIPFFLDNCKIKLSAHVDSIPEEINLLTNKYTYDNITIVGSQLNDLFFSFLNEKKRYDTKRTDIFMNEYIAFLNPSEGEQKGKLSKGVDIVKRIDQTAEERDNFIRQFIRKNSGNFVGLYAASDAIGSFSVTVIDSLVTQMDDELLRSEPGIKFIEKANEVKKTAIGSKFVDLAMKDKDGNPVQLSDFLGKGNYVLLEFWASWCGPCKADIPHLKDAYELYHPEGFEIVSVSMDNNREPWLKAIDDFKLNWPQISELKAFDGDAARIYRIRGVPTCILIGPDGKIITRNMRGSWMQGKLVELYGNKFGDAY